MNLVHHSPVEWNTTVEYIKDALEKERNISLPFIPFQEWMERLEKVSGSTDTEEMNKIVCVLPIYRNDAHARILFTACHQALRLLPGSISRGQKPHPFAD